MYNYLEDVNDSAFRKSVYIAEPVIQKNDLLSVQVFSAATDPEIDALYNVFSQQQGGGGQNGGQNSAGYLVDVYGNIEIPRIGTIKAEGLKKSELEVIIKEKLKGLLTNPTVIIRFQNFRITFLGENASSVITFPSERVTILEAIGTAGGVSEFGTIKQVRVLREINGERQLGFLDLTSKEIFTSPYYQLQQNDVVIINKTRYRLRQTEQQRVTQQIGFATGLISTVALLIAIFNR